MTGMVEPGIYMAVIAILIWAAATDLKDRRIPNIQPLTILGLFGMLAVTRLIAGDGLAAAAAWPLVAGLLVFMFATILFALGLMGGGDVKLMTAVALFAGPTLGTSFVLYVALTGGIVALATLIHSWLISRDPSEPPQVPYGVAIMASGIWVCFQKVSVTSV